jgi:hypothetical protein
MKAQELCSRDIATTALGPVRMRLVKVRQVSHLWHGGAQLFLGDSLASA